MDDAQKHEIYRDFEKGVNIAPQSLEQWLESEESQSVGAGGEDGESTGHASGRKIVTILRKAKADLTEDDYAHMRKVNGYIARHMAQRPDGDVSETRWRYSLMNWGHDPLKS